jgi:hypothetical protein
MDCQATSSLCLTQPDLTPVPVPDLVSWPAQRLLPAQRQNLAVQVLAGTHPVADLARQHQVSRKFLYQQADTATHALNHAFDRAPAADRVLFNLPVTKAWLDHLVLALVLICHSSTRGVVELLRDLFDHPISLGPCTTSCTAPFLRPGESTSSTTSPASSSVSSMKSSRRAIPSWWGSMRLRPSASC